MTQKTDAAPAYTPNNPPQIRLPIGRDDITPEQLLDQLINIERYLDEELPRIAAALVQVPVQAAYGSVYLEDRPGPTRTISESGTLLQDWDAFAPNTPNRVDVVVNTGVSVSLRPLEAGVYYIDCKLTCDIEKGKLYIFSVNINGVASEIIGEIPISQQSEVYMVRMVGLRSLSAGDLLTIEGFVFEGGTQTFTMIDSVWSIFRVSERHHPDIATP